MENKLRELAKEFCKQHNYAKEDELFEFLVDKEWQIYCHYDKMSHKDKIIGELENNDYEVNKIPDDLIYSMVERFDDILYDDDDNYFDNCVRYVLEDYKEDLEEYKLEENDNE